ncbi:hypothetical protein Zmor_018678 [Zophobas morio]|uniref:Uncharacterized protein n=1 Tax=Zophobas morio TaxID=2755281 RepID=A0AA38IAK0_9CUCU|nr:hypothetical protein Zmor_018678 [Zophobas morio]
MPSLVRLVQRSISRHPPLPQRPAALCQPLRQMSPRPSASSMVLAHSKPGKRSAGAGPSPPPLPQAPQAGGRPAAARPNLKADVPPTAPGRSVAPTPLRQTAAGRPWAWARSRHGRPHGPVAQSGWRRRFGTCFADVKLASKWTWKFGDKSSIVPDEENTRAFWKCNQDHRKEERNEELKSAILQK